MRERAPREVEVIRRRTPRSLLPPPAEPVETPTFPQLSVTLGVLITRKH